MTKTVENYSQQALDMFEAGFTSKAGQKRAFEALGHAHSLLTRCIKDLVLAKPLDERTDAENEVYWGLADLHNWKAKHTAMVVAVFPQAASTCAEIESLADLRLAIKGAEIVKVERKPDERVQQVQKTIREMMAQRGAQYAHGLKLCEIFKGLPVTANVHWVVNQHGTEFTRAFYYMAGKLTPLNIILAVLQENARRQEAAQA